MKVSIIMPVYNRQEYLPEAVNTVLEQTYSDIELIIVDDGSHDSSLDIANDFASKFPENVKVLSQKNAGASAARNKGIDSATGDLIAFLDSDDLYEKTKIEEQVKLYKQYPDAGFIYCDYFIVNNENEVMRHVKSSDCMVGMIYEKLWLSANELCGGSMMVSRQNMIKVGGFNLELSGSENVDLRLKLSLLGNVFFVDKPLYRYRKHESNMTLDSGLMDECFFKLVTEHLGGGGEKNHRLWQRVMSIYYYKTGMRHFTVGEYQDATKSFLTSIKLNFRQHKPYVQLMRCLLGKRVNTAIAKIKIALTSGGA